MSTVSRVRRFRRSASGATSACRMGSAGAKRRAIDGTLFARGRGARDRVGRRETRGEVRCSQRMVNERDVLALRVSPAGGAAAILEPLNR